LDVFNTNQNTGASEPLLTVIDEDDLDYKGLNASDVEQIGVVGIGNKEK